MGILRGILLIVLLITPLLFQIVFGSGFILVSKKMKFWLICVISVLLLFVTYFIHTKFIGYYLVKNGIRCGMPYVGLMLMEAIIAIAIVLTILIQIFVKYFRNRKRSYYE